jgi:hypothetical protein
MTPRLALRVALVALPAAIGVAAAALVRDHATAARAAVLVTGAYVAAALLASMRRPAPPPRRTHPPRPAERLQPLARLERLERAVALSRSSALEYEHRLQPDLRRAAAERLRLRRGIDLDQRPEDARAVLGDRAWHMVAHRSGRDDRHAPAPAPADVTALLDSLEGV